MRSILRTLTALFALLLIPAVASAAPDAAAANDQGLRAVGAGLAIGLAGLGTGIAQARILSAGIGAIVEDAKNFGPTLLLVAIPETILIFGFVIAFQVK